MTTSQMTKNYTRMLSFKDYKGIGKVENIKDKYKIGKVIGEGSFGQVRIAMDRHANVKVAIKFIKKEQLKAHQKL